MDPIITIGREYGSGGREIGKLVADKLGVPFYDKEILTRAAEESGLCHELLERHDEKNTVSGMLAGSAGAGLHVGAGGMGLQTPPTPSSPAPHCARTAKRRHAAQQPGAFSKGESAPGFCPPVRHQPAMLSSSSLLPSSSGAASAPSGVASGSGVAARVFSKVRVATFSARAQVREYTPTCVA